MIRSKNEQYEYLRSSEYNWMFNPKSGFFMRSGKTLDHDPDYSPLGPEIADIEVSTVCSGPFGTPCAWCYKSNTASGENMLLETFIKVFNNINPYKNLTQIAFGVGDIDANPDLISMFEYCRENSVVPNITVNGARLYNRYKDGKTFYEKIAELCGAVAVSHYGDNICFNAVKQFTDLGMTQCNIHKILAEDTLDECMDLLKKRQKDSRLEKLNAIVFLLLKPKGDRNNLSVLKNNEKYRALIEYAVDNNISIGFDSCSANKFLDAVKNHKDYKKFETFAEPCESGLFSIYCNVKGEFYPCSFSEGVGDWKTGIDLVNTTNFMKDIWFSERVVEWRLNLLAKKRSCPVYDI